MAIGVIDAITSGRLTQDELLLHLFLYLLFAAFGMYYLRYVWRMYIRRNLLPTDKSCVQDYLSTYKMSPAFLSELSNRDLMAHATNDINALTQLAGGGVMSMVDASITALVLY